jgi:hypothetical protein
MVLLVPWHDLKLRFCWRTANQHALSQAALNGARHHSASLGITQQYWTALIVRQNFLLEHINQGYAPFGVVRHSRKHAVW